MELDYKEAEISASKGLVGPKGLPPQVTARLTTPMNEIPKMPAVVATMNALGIDPVGGELAVLARQVPADNERCGKLVKDFAISAE